MTEERVLQNDGGADERRKNRKWQRTIKELITLKNDEGITEGALSGQKR